MSAPTGGRREIAEEHVAIPLTDESIVVPRVDIQALAENSGPIHVGGSSLRSEPGFVNGMRLEPGHTINYQDCDLHEVFVSGGTIGDGVSYTVS